MFDDILIALVSGMVGGALYVALRLRVLGLFRKSEDRNAGLNRYQDFKAGKR